MEAPTQRYRDLARRFREQALPHREGAVFEPATSAELAGAEEALGCRFPASYGWFQLEFDDWPQGPLDVYSVRRPQTGRYNIVGINQDERTDACSPLPPHLIAFSDNGGGDLCCFDTAALQGGECPVVWWDHEGDETQEHEVAAPSFLDWLEAELKERAEEAPGSLLDSLPHVYQQWMREWFKNK